MVKFPIAILLLCFVAGCIHPEARGLKHPDPTQLEAGWGKWDRPEFSIAAPENWSPYRSRVQQRVPPPEGEQPTNAMQWTILDKDTDEALIENLGKQGIPLRLYDNAARNLQGVIQTQLTMSTESSEANIPDEIKKFKKSLSGFESDAKVTLPVGTAKLFRSQTKEANRLDFLLINGDTKILARFETTGDKAALEPLARKIMETFRVKG